MKEFLNQLKDPYTGEQLFDCLADIVYFIKDAEGKYVTINATLVERCGVNNKSDLIGKKASELHGRRYGEGYEEQDADVINTGIPLLNLLELHAYRTGEPGWCITNKLPLEGKEGNIIGLVGISQDLKMPNLSSSEYRRLQNAIQYTETHLDQNVKIQDIASSAAMSPFQFDRCVQRVFGLTAGQWLLKTKIDKAERALVSTDRQIAEIALDVGYSDQSTFTRQFRKTTGMSPANYRQQLTPLRAG